MNTIKVGICGYGNLGKGIEEEIKKSDDMELVAIFTRRNPSDLKTNSDVPVINVNEMEKWTDKIDVMIMCGGSATDLPVQVVETAKLFNTVDSFDTHAKIPEYYNAVNESASKANKTSVISGGWDPGMFSVMRTYADAILSNGKTYTFWGKGVSQGHSDAIRRIEGVVDARQYTVPVQEALDKVRAGENPELTTREKHTRVCYVVAEEGADKARIEKEIVTMPNYFADYDTTVNFISAEEMKAEHSGLPHGGSVIYSGTTGGNENADGTTSKVNTHVIEYSLKLDSNPEFTGSVLVAYARAAYRMNQAGDKGAKTVFDVAPALLSPLSGDDIRAHML